MAAPEQTQDPAKATKPGRLVLHRIFWIVLACFVALSIFTHDASDPAWTQWGSGPTHNAAGQFGAYLSDILGFMFGSVVYAVPCLLFWRVALFWYQPPLALTGWRQAAAWIVSLFSLASLLALHQYQPGYGLDNAAGGLFGRTLGLAMWQATGLIGGTLILGTVFVLTFTLASGLSWPFVLERTGRLLWQGLTGLQAICTPIVQNWRSKRSAPTTPVAAPARSEARMPPVRQEPVMR